MFFLSLESSSNKTIVMARCEEFVRVVKSEEHIAVRKSFKFAVARCASLSCVNQRRLRERFDMQWWAQMDEMHPHNLAHDLLYILTVSDLKDVFTFYEVCLKDSLLATFIAGRYMLVNARLEPEHYRHPLILRFHELRKYIPLTFFRLIQIKCFVYITYLYIFFYRGYGLFGCRTRRHEGVCGTHDRSPAKCADRGDARP